MISVIIKCTEQIPDLNDIYYYRYSESGDITFFDHITVPKQPVNHIIDSGQRPPIIGDITFLDHITVPKQLVNHIIDSEQWSPITGRENGRTYYQCDICMKKFKFPDFWRKHFQKDSCIRSSII
ncbi:25660_t:CDS:2 [Gigaspora margarita]|uniref:25660_t:CDS:1 n=1 Tax=Gigaspora margarita TaxID=4874 RepID=A0ABN7V3K9_GIGMA|nr:25660_t:CDS:2 [Gigaspora margarita]